MRQPNLWKSFQHAGAGIVHTLRTQRNARIHFVAATVALSLAGWLQLDPVRWSILLLTVGGVCVGEMLNTAVEAIVDLLSPEWHERAKVAKDVSAGAVLILSISAVAVGCVLLGPPLWTRLFG